MMLALQSNILLSNESRAQIRKHRPRMETTHGHYRFVSRNAGRVMILRAGQVHVDG
jgi:hypothetical protein